MVDFSRQQNGLLLKDRRFSSAIAKACCQKVYGRAIHPSTYRNWRSWAGVKKGVKDLSFEEFCFLVAIAEIRCRTFPVAPELSRVDVQTVADSVEIQAAIVAAIEKMDSLGFVYGRDAVKALSDRGLNVGRTNLYNLVPGFSASKIYRLDSLLTWVC